ncbi:hypothetical protein HHK36_018354 [Tetracentron sinense]|uniref:DUF4378 domain-containing protein n=1 Tax=Tetracentron sinense TaxID=13715 RepID=A0A834YYD2_TETSI|nr:hypothetical protein HHK36_018354 [Tetracentron sinense]
MVNVAEYQSDTFVFSDHVLGLLCVKMERFELKRSHGRVRHYRGYEAKIANLAYQKSGTNLVLTGRALGEGNSQVRNRREAPKLSSDSISCSSGTTDEDSFASDLRRRQAGEATIKRLLAEELSKQMESTRRPPSVIARLMGFEGLPPQQPVHKHQKGSSFGKSVKKQQEFKDVFEVLETSKAERQGTANSKLTEAEVAFIRQKFMDAKRLSTDEKLQHSKEFHDALEVLESNKDLLLKFLQEPDSLFTKHLHDIKGVPPHPQFGIISVLKSSNAPNYENSDICWKSERKTDGTDVTNSLQKHDNGLVKHSHSKHVHNSHKSSKSHLEGIDETCLLPTRIVVLKPNLGNAQNAERFVSSPSSSEGFRSGYRKHKEILSSKNKELFAEIWERKTSSNDVELLRHRSRDSRQIANEITRKMRHNASGGFVKVSRSRIRGYAGDESSCYTSGNDSASESDVVRQTSRNYFDWRNQYTPSSSYSNESSVSREAKKRISERLRMTHRFQEAGLCGSGSTLGEMLAIPDREMRPTNSVSMIGEDGVSDRSARNDGARCSSPLGISSRDGWKGGCARNLQKSKSLPASATVFGSPRTSIRHGALSNDKCLMPKEAINQGMSKSRKRTSNQKGSSFPRNPRSGIKESQSSLREDKDNNHIVKEIEIDLNELGNNILEKDLSEEKAMVAESSAGIVADTSLVADRVENAVPEDAAMSSESPEELLLEPTVCILLTKDGDSSSHDPNDSLPQETSIGHPVEVSIPLHCAVPEPESPASCKEADHRSPVSVLEPPFVEEISSGSECFDRVSADLQGLRIKLQLLKLESSEAYSEGLGMIVSSDEDTEEGSMGLLPVENGAEENREFSYLFDVLVDSGFLGAELELVLATWYSPECPVGLLVFETLEKKYGEQTSWTRSERRLLFDRINSALIEILRPYMDPHPWVKPVWKKVGPRWCKESLEEELWNLLVSQEKEVSEDSSEKAMGREMRWMELGDDVDVIGREIERWLIGDVISEVVSMFEV